MWRQTVSIDDRQRSPDRFAQRGRPSRPRAVAQAIVAILVLVAGYWWLDGREQRSGAPTSEAAAAAAPIAFVGLIGDDVGPFRSPAGIALDLSGNLYAIDALNDRIEVFGGDGALIATWGGTGAEPGRFRFHGSGMVHGDLAIDRDGHVYVSDLINDRIQKFGPDGSFLLEWGAPGTGNGQFIEPTGIAVDAGGRVYVADYPTQRVQVFGGSGEYLDTWGGLADPTSPIQGPNDIAIDVNGAVYVSDDITGQIHRFDAAGTYLGSFGEQGDGPGQCGYCWGLVVDAAGNVYVADLAGGCIHVFGPDGALIGSWDGSDLGSREFQAPIYLALDGEGFLYLADEDAWAIQKFRLLPPLGPETDTGGGVGERSP